ncbi:Rieske (2Fe-2S) protein [Halorussus salinisoli]|uniref:Rieske (2Fe-2S) protein n=1 Tax=Halorussus salinisoli TaxID=2558242 RepID=UPI0010C1AE95|nr:Rieske 2Fe-2S domain-containing protein [Halorussus salinisoli]
MTERTRLTTTETVYEEGSWLFTVRDQYGEPDEVLLVPCEDESDGPVEAWINRCTHEAQRFDRGFGAPMRDGQLVCPKHGSMFDACSGYCDNGDAADTTLVSVDLAVEDGAVYLTDDSYEFAHAGSIEDGGTEGAEGEGTDEEGRDDESDDDMPSSTSHIGF